jgi:hypothetical protein
METETPHAKAAGFNSSLETVRQMVGAERFARFVATLPQEARELVEKPPLPVAWIPIEKIIPVHQGVWNELFGGDRKLVFEMGRRQLHADMSTIYRVFIRLLAPRFVLDRTARIWGTYTRGAGTLRLVRDEERSVDLLLEGHPAKDPLFYEYLRGSMFGIIELTRVGEPSVEIVEGGTGDGRCRYRIGWA